MKIPEEVASVINVVAPTVATALGGPAAGIAAKIVVGALTKYLAPGVTAANAKPSDILSAIERNADNPELPKDLKAAEKSVQDYEREYNLKFAELEAKERTETREFQKTAGIADEVFKFGKQIAISGLVLLLVLTGFVVALMFGLVRMTYDATVITVGFGFISTVTTAYISFTTQVLSYYFGSSRGSDAKTTAISETLQDQGARLGEAVAAVAKDRPAPALPAPPVIILPDGKPAPSPADSIAWQQGPFGGARWKVLPEGVLVEGDAAVARSVGEPVTIRRIWQDHGRVIRATAEKLGVPAEIITMTIATESKGQPRAYLTEPDGRVSVGLMQILVGTASEVMGRDVTFDELQNPELNILAGASYILKQKDKTWFDVVLTAASYNAGGLYPPREGKDNNRFNLRSTGDHLERAIRWYGDICFVAKQDGWFK